MLIIFYLSVCLGNVRIFTGGGFQLNYNKGKSIDKNYHIRAFFKPGISNSPLIGNNKTVLFHMLKIK